MSSILYQFSKNMDNVFYFIPILWTMLFILWTIKNMDNVFYFVPVLWTIKKHGQCLLFCTNFMDNKKNMGNVFYFVPILWTIKKLSVGKLIGVYQGASWYIGVYWCTLGYIGVICGMSGYIGLYWGTSFPTRNTPM
jgi:hypothetical protein